MPETEAALAARAELEKLTKEEIIERFIAAAEDFERRQESREPRRARPEDALMVSALLDLHRAALHAVQPDAQRFLNAALKLGGPLADSILAD